MYFPDGYVYISNCTSWLSKYIFFVFLGQDEGTAEGSRKRDSEWTSVVNLALYHRRVCFVFDGSIWA